MHLLVQYKSTRTTKYTSGRPAPAKAELEKSSLRNKTRIWLISSWLVYETVVSTPIWWISTSAKTKILRRTVYHPTYPKMVRIGRETKKLEQKYDPGISGVFEDFLNFWSNFCSQKSEVLVSTWFLTERCRLRLSLCPLGLKSCF